MALILMGFAEAQGPGSTWLHAAGIALLAGRLLHLLGLNPSQPKNPLRIAGGVLTQLVIAACAGFLLYGAVN